jgi:hypothetical protein
VLPAAWPGGASAHAIAITSAATCSALPPAGAAPHDAGRVALAAVADLVPACGLAKCRDQVDAGLVFIADDLGAWLVAALAEAGRNRLVTWARGSDQERALRQAADAAVQACAVAAIPAGSDGAEQLALVIGEVFSAAVPDARMDGCATLLEALQAGVARQLAVLDDSRLTGTATSTAAALGISAAALADNLASCLVQEIVADGARGGHLAGLAGQLNDDATHLQGLRLERMLQQLIDIVLKVPATGRRTPAGRLITGITSPVMLGVHKAIAAGGPDDDNLPELPAYVPRSHDETLTRLIDESQHASTLMVVTGDSAAGKTRALWEAVRCLPPAWRLWRPTDAQDLSDGLSAGGVISHTVVWLDDAHEFIDPRRTQLAGPNADALRDLMGDPERHPVLIAATMWSDAWRYLTSPAGGPDQEGNQAVRDLKKVASLLESATRVAVPPAFQGIDLEAAKDAARRWPARQRSALSTGRSRQGGPGRPTGQRSAARTTSTRACRSRSGRRRPGRRTGCWCRWRGAAGGTGRWPGHGHAGSPARRG